MLSKQYNPQEHEDEIYNTWLESGYFNPDNLPSTHTEPFAIMFPPPNVTGVLHLGHALENAIMDSEIRYQRMRGKKTLLLPGTDHAAVATQARVESNLKKQGIQNPRQEYGREGLLKIIREYAEQSKSTILGQIKKMGTSCDWSRLAYTFDEPRSKAVNTLFKQMYDDGLIYRGYRVVNWSAVGQSTCSDDELVYVDQPTKLYTFKYTKDFPIVIATTRPETKLGDTAVAVHPSDERYANYIGQKFTVDVGANKPLTIIIIGDEGVDPNYGTGALGVTPAHSTTDFAMYQKNKAIGLVPVIDQAGKMTANAGKNYEGLTITEARQKFVEYLKTNDLLIKEEDITHNVATSDRFGDVIESLPMEQWFIDVNKVIPNKGTSLKDLMRSAVTSQAVSITPERFQNTYLHWIDNLQDWCISRQIWWGHRIPVWYKDKEVFCGVEAPTGDTWTQDPDTLDTWFSSATWTFSTLGWPSSAKAPAGKPDDFAMFHPTAWMQMGHEILFFWMARMIMMSMYLFDDVPFKRVYIHGILRAKDGRKFSKSLGNGIDPLDIIKQYGTDALRLSLLKGITPGNDAKFYEDKVEDARNFVNKLWNVARYVLQNQTSPLPSPAGEGEMHLTDAWIQSKLTQLIQNVTNAFEQDQFSIATEQIYDFLWHDFADWYIEVKKFEPNPELTQQILETILKLAHPFIPFVTETIWQQVYPGKFLMIEQWPEFDTKNINEALEKQFSTLQDIITQIRDLRAKYKIGYDKKITIYTANQIDSNLQTIIEHFTKVTLKLGQASGTTTTLTNPEFNFNLQLGDLVDAPAEKARLQKEITQLEKYIAGLTAKLSNETFTAKAPQQLVEQTKQLQAEKEQELAEHKKALENLSV